MKTLGLLLLLVPVLPAEQWRMKKQSTTTVVSLNTPSRIYVPSASLAIGLRGNVAAENCTEKTQRITGNNVIRFANFPLFMNGALVLSMTVINLGTITRGSIKVWTRGMLNKNGLVFIFAKLFMIKANLIMGEHG